MNLLKYTKRFILLSLLAVLLFSCNKEEIFDDATGTYIGTYDYITYGRYIYPTGGFEHDTVFGSINNVRMVVTKGEYSGYEGARTINLTIYNNYEIIDDYNQITLNPDNSVSYSYHTYRAPSQMQSFGESGSGSIRQDSLQIKFRQYSSGNNLREITLKGVLVK
jgi:hypothetical protein